MDIWLLEFDIRRIDVIEKKASVARIVLLFDRKKTWLLILCRIISGDFLVNKEMACITVIM